MTEHLTTCRVCGFAARIEVFGPTKNIPTPATMVFCSNHPMFGGDCTMDEASLGHHAWNSSHYGDVDDREKAEAAYTAHSQYCAFISEFTNRHAREATSTDLKNWTLDVSASVIRGLLAADADRARYRRALDVIADRSQPAAIDVTEPKVVWVYTHENGEIETGWQRWLKDKGRNSDDWIGWNETCVSVPGTVNGNRRSPVTTPKPEYVGDLDDTSYASIKVMLDNAGIAPADGGGWLVLHERVQELANRYSTLLDGIRSARDDGRYDRLDRIITKCEE